MKIAVLTDVHGNLPALQAALRGIRREGCDAIFHTGDSIGIGPYPAECLELLLNTPNPDETSCTSSGTLNPPIWMRYSVIWIQISCSMATIIRIRT